MPEVFGRRYLSIPLHVPEFFLKGAFFLLPVPSTICLFFGFAGEHLFVIIVLISITKISPCNAYASQQESVGS